jgi:hypothetical protein
LKFSVRGEKLRNNKFHCSFYSLIYKGAKRRRKGIINLKEVVFLTEIIKNDFTLKLIVVVGILQKLQNEKGKVDSDPAFLLVGVIKI